MHNFLKVCLLYDNPGTIAREKASYCYIFGIAGNRKVKFGEVSLQISQNFWREN